MKARLKDQLNLASKLTPSKVFNSAKLLASYYWSRITKKPVQWGYPASISFEPTTSCNLRCPECPSGLRAFTRPTGMLDNKFFKDSITQLKKELHYLTFYFQGEPYLNPKFLDMVKFAHDNKIYTATSTNAHYLKPDIAKKTIESGLDRLIISIDGTSQETYQSYRVGGKLEKVIEGARNIIAAKNEMNSTKPFVIFQFLVVKPNEHQIDDVLKFINKEIKSGNQIFWVCPLIEVSKKLDHSSAVMKFEYLEKNFPNQVCLLHGKTDLEEKNKILNDYLNNKFKIFNSTLFETQNISKTS